MGQAVAHPSWHSLGRRLRAITAPSPVWQADNARFQRRQALVRDLQAEGVDTPLIRELLTWIDGTTALPAEYRRFEGLLRHHGFWTEAPDQSMIDLRDDVADDQAAAPMPAVSQAV